VTKLKVGDRVAGARIWLQKLITGKETRPKIARKKVQIQFDKTHQQFIQQISLLEARLARPGLSTSSLELGRNLLQEAQRYQELQLSQINQSRLETLPESLLHPVDFSMWVLYHTYSLSEEIYHYLKTCEAVEL
jgi:hypothetical protein